MSNTPKLGLPLLLAAQAQKHVTVNEALVLLDAVAGLTLVSATVAAPPPLAVDGDAYGVPAGATGAWAGRDSEIAIRSNGGWVFVVPQKGWRARVVDVDSSAIFDGTGWVVGGVGLSVNKAATVQEIIELEHDVTAGPTNTVTAAIPAQSMVIGVTGRVTTAISGALSDWKIGVAGTDNRYGSGLGLSLGAWVRGLTSAPQTYYADTDLLLTSNGGDFAAGHVRLAVHLLRLNIPSV